MSEFFSSFRTRRERQERSPIPENDQPIQLGDQRLLISTHLGDIFTDLLEGEDPLHGGLSIYHREEIQKAYNAIVISFSNNRRGVIDIRRIPEGEIVTAHLLRSARPNMIIGHQVKEGDNVNSVLKSLGRQLGLTEVMSTRQVIGDRLVGREKVALVILDTNLLDPASIRKLTKELKGVPSQGVLILSS